MEFLPLSLVEKNDEQRATVLEVYFETVCRKDKSTQK
jgi:hypothetical protein